MECTHVHMCMHVCSYIVKLVVLVVYNSRDRYEKMYDFQNLMYFKARLITQNPDKCIGTAVTAC